MLRSLPMSTAVHRELMNSAMQKTDDEDERRVDACTDLTTLERRLDRALVAQSVADALK